MTDEQLRAAIMDIVTDAWDRSRQIDGAVDEIMDAVALAAQHPSQSAGEPAAIVDVSVPHLRSIVVKVLPEVDVPPVGALVYTSPPPTDAARASDQVARIVHLRADREKRIYIAGPMTGLPEFNFPAFNAKAVELRAEGWHVENPAEHGHVKGARWADYLRWDISRIVTCGAIYLLPGWETSKGAQLEVYIGKALGLTFLGADAARASGDEPLTEFQEGQWWIAELDAMVKDAGTDDQKRAVAVVHHLLRASSAAPAEPDAARASGEVNMRRRAFIQGWDERGKAYGLHGSVESDAAMKILMDIYHPRIAPAEPANAGASEEAAAIMREVEKFVDEMDAQNRPSGSVIRLGLLPRIRQLIGQPYSIDVDPGGIRARVADAITGALACGAQGTNPPPNGHWLAPFWESARAERNIALRDKKTEPLDYCTDPNNCARCMTHPNHRGKMQHAGIGKHPWDCAEPDAARASGEVPIDMVLHCPACGMQHIDRPDPPSQYAGMDGTSNEWTCPPHRSHLCRPEDGGCGHIWRPADVPTNGVAAVKTKGKADSPIATPAEPDAARVEADRRDAERWRLLESASSTLTLRVHNTQPGEPRRAVIDAALKEKADENK